MQSVNAILKLISDAVAGFQKTIPGIQDKTFKELQPIIKDLQTKNGRILNNVDNLRLIGSLRNKLEKIVLNAEYKNAIRDFTDSFTALDDLNLRYFKQFNKKYSPSKTLPIIKNLSIESTINDLAGQGLNANVVAPLQEILRQNITTGGSFAAFQDQIRTFLLNDENGDGALVKHTKQITVDAINQYNAQYTDVIAQDLNMDWMMYTGSLLTTSREFCIYLVQKKWIHRSELPDIIRGYIDGHQCRLSKTTKLPLGMIPGTNPDNFSIRRGGYLCGHGAFWVAESSVPADVRAAFKANTPIREVMSKARASAHEIDVLGTQVADKFEGSVTPINFKTKSSIERKVNNELGGDVSKLKDAVRNTVVVKYSDLEKVVDYLKTLPEYKVEGARVKLQEGDAYFGYKGVLTNIVTKNGLIAEMQVNSPGMIYAKVPKAEALHVMSEEMYNDIAKKTGVEGGLGHVYYEELRTINPATATPAQLKRMNELVDLSKKYYAKFYGF